LQFYNLSVFKLKLLHNGVLLYVFNQKNTPLLAKSYLKKRLSTHMLSAAAFFGMKRKNLKKYFPKKGLNVVVRLKKPFFNFLIYLVFLKFLFLALILKSIYFFVSIHGKSFHFFMATKLFSFTRGIMKGINQKVTLNPSKVFYYNRFENENKKCVGALPFRYEKCQLKKPFVIQKKYMFFFK